MHHNDEHTIANGGANDVASEEVRVHSKAVSSEVLRLADTCFEMFSIRELKYPRAILPELKAAFPSLTTEQLSDGIWQAIAWKRVLCRIARGIH